eukprot:scaffold4463_cov51-Attheya_sp.AAC.20
MFRQLVGQPRRVSRQRLLSTLRLAATSHHSPCVTSAERPVIPPLHHLERPRWLSTDPIHLFDQESIQGIALDDIASFQDGSTTDSPSDPPIPTAPQSSTDKSLESDEITPDTIFSMQDTDLKNAEGGKPDNVDAKTPQQQGAEPEGPVDTPVSTIPLVSVQSKVYNGRLQRAIELKKMSTAMEIFYEADKLGHKMSPENLSSLIIMMPLQFHHMYSVLKNIHDQVKYAEHHGNEPPLSKTLQLSLYRRVCVQFRQDETMTNNRLKLIAQDLTGMVLSFRNTNDEIIETCLPRLMYSLLKRSLDKEGKLTSFLWYYLFKYNLVNMKDDFVLYEEILSRSSYQTNSSFPYSKVLLELCRQGYQPKAFICHQVLGNMFPFTNNIDTAKDVITFLIEWEKNENPPTKRKTNTNDYRLDLGTLEELASTAARMRRTDVILVVWDALDAFGYRPNEGMYESAIQAFASSNYQDQNAFAVLAEMETEGYVPSRVLIRTVSHFIRGWSVGRLDNAYYILVNGTEGTRITTASLNCIMSACAEGGLVDRTFATFDDFAEYRLEPDLDTFSFFMESLSVDIASTLSRLPALPKNSSEELEAKKEQQRQHKIAVQVEAADFVLDMMKETGLSPTVSQYVLKYYTQIMCLSADVEHLKKAHIFMQEARDAKHRVSMDSINDLVRRYTNLGQCDTAREVASLAGNKNGDIPSFLLNNIATMENKQAAEKEPNEIMENKQATEIEQNEIMENKQATEIEPNEIMENMQATEKEQNE